MSSSHQSKSWNPCQSVRETTKFLQGQPEIERLVRIDSEALDRLVLEASENMHKLSVERWNGDDIHFDDVTRPDLLCQYLLVMDVLNFCFWPTPGMEYHHLSLGLKNALEQDEHCLDADRLLEVTEADLTKWYSGHHVPLLHARLQFVRLVGQTLLEHFEGKALELVRRAGGSAVDLVRLVVTHFVPFQDHAVFEGRQVYFYKRAQIFVADVYGAFRGQGFASFADLHELTMFADYRVPQVLRHDGVFVYSDDLAQKIDRQEPMIPNCLEELALRSATVELVERMKERLFAKTGVMVPAITIDWFLWQRGENMVLSDNNPMKPHHRVRTVYY